MDLFEELRALLEALRRENLPYALCGGLAVAVYGITRATEDIDLLVEESGLPQIRALAEQLGYRFDSRPLHSKGDQVIYRLFKLREEDLMVLNLLPVTPLTQPAWDSRQMVDTDFGPLQAVSPSGLIHLKSLRQSGKTRMIFVN